MSIAITFPDGRTESYEHPPTGLEIAQNISPGLAKKAVVVDVDGELWDLNRPIEHDARIDIVTRDRPEGVEVLRHDAAHVLAQAVQELFPGTQITFGPSTDTGFYYDFVRDEPFSQDDLEAIEQRMRDIVQRDLPIERQVWNRDEAIAHFKQLGETYKAQWIAEGIDPHEEITVYTQGENWKDLCTGPHLPSTGRLGTAFKLTKLSGAYWRGDKNNAQLQRIYGLAFADDKQLKAHLRMLEEAEKRDHRKLGRQLDLFHFQEEAPGSVFWHPKGWTVFQGLIDYMRRQQRRAGYQEVNTPDMMDLSLWKRSGHWENYGENMFTTERDEDRILALKPMNCPGHVAVFNQGLRSYRELPLRLAEFGKVHRFEPSGALHGLLRVRSFTQDDAHVFCTREQMHAECIHITQLTLAIYKDFGFDNIVIKLSTRPEKRIGADELWDQAESALANALGDLGLEYTVFEGEGAFYGPKLEFVLRDAIGRDWQCGTLQLDFNLPGRLDAEYVGEDSAKHTPIMIHRAMFGSLERFFGILIEHHAGALPSWLAPVQVQVATIVSDADDYARDACARMQAAGIRAETDLRNEKINLKVRESSLAKVPAMAVVGRREAEEGTVALRRLGSKDQQVLSLDDAIEILKQESLPPSET
ncbi:threonine--tRNA ligase [Algiphilus sp.]|uniref:threonine--tRNA ligase n=3 Tax=Algiphilus sp. TaxID=1872431 RepID=UPI002A5C66D7|nr:threonine--tRNA ligase [Pseudomonadota bacterium]